MASKGEGRAAGAVGAAGGSGRTAVVVALLAIFAPGVTGAESQKRLAHPDGAESGRAEAMFAADTEAVSPRGDRMLYLQDGLIYLAAVEGNPAGGGDADRGAPLFTTTGVVREAVWSPDGTRIAFVMAPPKARSEGPATVHELPTFIGVFDLDTGTRSFLRPALAWDTTPVWSPEGERIAFLRRIGPSASWGGSRVETNAPTANTERLTIWVAALATGEVRQIWKGGTSSERGSPADRIRWEGRHIVVNDAADASRSGFAIPVDTALGTAADPPESAPGPRSW